MTYEIIFVYKVNGRTKHEQLLLPQYRAKDGDPTLQIGRDARDGHPMSS